MSTQRRPQRRPKGKGRQKGGGKGSGAKRVVDSGRGFWSNGVAEEKVRAITGQVRPAEDPTALVRSLGPGPLGRHAQAGTLTFDVVYRKAAQLAIAAAVSNGVLLDEDGDGTGTEALGAP